MGRTPALPVLSVGTASLDLCSTLLSSELFKQVYGQGSNSGWPAEEEAPDVECHICMDAEVEVESLPCKHR